jgi:hypothetical protein
MPTLSLDLKKIPIENDRPLILTPEEEKRKSAYFAALFKAEPPLTPAQMSCQLVDKLQQLVGPHKPDLRLFSLSNEENSTFKSMLARELYHEPPSFYDKIRTHLADLIWLLERSEIARVSLARKTGEDDLNNLNLCAKGMHGILLSSIASLTASKEEGSPYPAYVEHMKAIAQTTSRVVCQSIGLNAGVETHYPSRELLTTVGFIYNNEVDDIHKVWIQKRLDNTDRLRIHETLFFTGFFGQLLLTDWKTITPIKDYLSKQINNIAAAHRTSIGAEGLFKQVSDSLTRVLGKNTIEHFFDTIDGPFFIQKKEEKEFAQALETYIQDDIFFKAHGIFIPYNEEKLCVGLQVNSPIFQQELTALLQNRDGLAILFKLVVEGKIAAEVLSQGTMQFGEIQIPLLYFICALPAFHFQLATLLPSFTTQAALINSLFRVLPGEASIFANTSPFYWLVRNACASKAGSAFLMQLMTLPKLIENIPLNQLYIALFALRSPEAGVDSTSSAFYWLIRNPATALFILPHLLKIPGFLKNMTPEQSKQFCAALFTQRPLITNNGHAKQPSVAYYLLYFSNFWPILAPLLTRSKCLENMSDEQFDQFYGLLFTKMRHIEGYDENTSTFYMLLGGWHVQGWLDKPEFLARMSSERLKQFYTMLFALQTHAAPSRVNTSAFYQLAGEKRLNILESLGIYKAEFLEKLSPQQLTQFYEALFARRHHDAKLSNTSAFYGLVAHNKEYNILNSWLNNPEFLKKLPPQQLIPFYEALFARRTHDAKSDANTSAFYWLATAPAGRDLLKNWGIYKPEFLKKLPPQQLIPFYEALFARRTYDATFDANTSTFYFLAATPTGRGILKNCGIDKPEFLKKLPPQQLTPFYEALFARRTHADANTSAFFHLLAATHEEFSILNSWLNNPKFLEKLPPQQLTPFYEALFAQRTQNIANISALYLLARNPKGCDILKAWEVDKSEFLKKLPQQQLIQFYEALFVQPPALKNNSALYWLVHNCEGHDILKGWLSNSEFLKNIPPAQVKQFYTTFFSFFKILTSSSEKQDILLHFLNNPEFLARIPHTQLYQALFLNESSSYVFNKLTANEKGGFILARLFAIPHLLTIIEADDLLWRINALFFRENPGPQLPAWVQNCNPDHGGQFPDTKITAIFRACGMNLFSTYNALKNRQSDQVMSDVRQSLRNNILVQNEVNKILQQHTLDQYQKKLSDLSPSSTSSLSVSSSSSSTTQTHGMFREHKDAKNSQPFPDYGCLTLKNVYDIGQEKGMPKDYIDYFIAGGMTFSQIINYMKTLPSPSDSSSVAPPLSSSSLGDAPSSQPSGGAGGAPSTMDDDANPTLRKRKSENPHDEEESKAGFEKKQRRNPSI